MAITIKTEYLSTDSIDDIVAFFHNQGERTIKFWPNPHPITVPLLLQFISHLHRRQIIVVARTSGGSVLGVLLYSRPSTLLDNGRWPFSIDQIVIDTNLSDEDGEAVDEALTSTTTMFRPCSAAV